jgi:hypothetical protein
MGVASAHLQLWKTKYQGTPRLIPDEIKYVKRRLLHDRFNGFHALHYR